MSDEKINAMLRSIQKGSMIDVYDFVATFKEYMQAKEANELLKAEDLLNELIPMAKKILLINRIVEYSKMICEEGPRDMDTTGIQDAIQELFRCANTGDLEATMEIAKKMSGMVREIESGYEPMDNEGHYPMDDKGFFPKSEEDVDMDFGSESSQPDFDMSNEWIDNMEHLLDEIAKDDSVPGEEQEPNETTDNLSLTDEMEIELSELILDDEFLDDDNISIDESLSTHDTQLQSEDEEIPMMDDTSIGQTETDLSKTTFKIHESLIELKCFDTVDMSMDDKIVFFDGIKTVLELLIREEFSEAEIKIEDILDSLKDSP